MMDQDGIPCGRSPAAAQHYNLRARKGSQEGQAPASGPIVAWTLQLVFSALSNFGALRTAIDETALRNYNDAWLWLLDQEGEEIKHQARKVQYRKESVDDVWERMLAEIAHPGALMLAMHKCYEDAMRRPLVITDKNDLFAMVIKYLQEKTVFRRRVDLYKPEIIRRIKEQQRKTEKGFDPEREKVWNRRAAIVSEYRRTVNAEIRKYEQMIKAASAAIEQRRAMIESFDPAYFRVLALLEPSDTVFAAWTREYADLDDEVKQKDWGNTIDAFLAEKRREHMEQQKQNFLKNDAMWADFVGADEVVLKKELRRRELALEKIKVSEFYSNIQRAFPEFDPTIIRDVEIGEGGRASYAPDSDPNN